MKKSLSLLLLFSIFLITPLYAQLKGLIIEAEKVTYLKDKNQMEAEGSVEVTYKDMVVRGEHIIYNASEEALFADRGFVFTRGGMTFEGVSLNYAVSRKRGSALGAKFFYMGAELKGKRLKLDAEKFELYAASFTTCSLDDPHYRVTTSDLILYPQYGWLVGYWGWFWLGNIPLVPMPTYIYDFRARDRNRRNVPPFPEIGSNSDDGSFVNERLAWYINQNLSGNYSLTYAANKGLGGGVEAGYFLDEKNNGDARLYYNQKDHLFGGITHLYSFGKEEKESFSNPFGFTAFPSRYQRQLETILSSRERINYERISFTPNLSLSSRSTDFYSKNAKLDWNITGGMVAEEGNTRLLRAGGRFKLRGDFPETKLGYITPYLSVDSLFYSDKSRWLKDGIGFDLTKNVIARDMVFGLGYLHYLYQEGASPFRYEMYHFRPADNLSSSLFFRLGETGAKVAASYYLDDWSPQDIDYSLFFKLHCYNLAVTYRSLRQEFNLSFSLAEGF